MSSEVKANKISPATGTDVTLGDASDTFTIPASATIQVASSGEIDIASGATLDVNGTLDVTGATVTGLSAGKVLQVVSSTKTDTASTTSTSFVTTGLEVSITPSATSSKIFIIANPVLGGGQNSLVGAQLWRDASVLIQGDTAGNRIRLSTGWLYSYAHYEGHNTPVVYLDSPSSTSSLTYKLMYSTSNASYTAYMNRSELDSDTIYFGRSASTITVMEIEG